MLQHAKVQLLRVLDCEEEEITVVSAVHVDVQDTGVAGLLEFKLLHSV